MQVNRTDFLKALSGLKPGISSKGIDQSASVIFSQGRLATYNEQIMVMIPFDCGGIEGAVRTEELTGILNKLTVEKIDISLGGEQLILKAGRSKSGLRFDKSIRLPVFEILDTYKQAEHRPLSDKLIPALQRAKFCASTNMNNLILTGIHYSEGCIEATNNYKAIQIRIPGKAAKQIPEFLIPAMAVDYLAQYQFEELAITDSWAFFAGKQDLLFCVRLLALEESLPYPDISPLMNKKGESLILPSELAGTIDKAEVFLKSVAHDADKQIAVKIMSDNIRIKGEGDYGWYEETIPIEKYEGKQIEFFANPEFLKDIVPKIQDAIFCDTLLLFKGRDFSYVFALLNPPLDEEEKEEI